MPPDPSNPYVTSATIKDNKIELSINVSDYDSGDYVEISGSAAQTSGAFANFYSIEQVPAEPNDPADPKSTKRYVYVSAQPLPPHKFRENEDVSAVIRVGRVWLTVLGKGPAEETSTSVPKAGEGAKWLAKRVSEITGDARN